MMCGLNFIMDVDGSIKIDGTKAAGRCGAGTLMTC